MKSTIVVVLGLALGMFYPCLGNVCTPYNVPASGVFPAVVNGIDGVGSYSARISWTTDGTAAYQRVEYATAAEWASSPGTYPHYFFPYQGTIGPSPAYTSALLSNLQANTTYHVAGQSYISGAWCSVTDETFTTLAAPNPTRITPVAPQRPSTIMPTMTGTHWVYGSNCGTTGGVTAQVQDCFNKAQPGDDIGFPPGTYSLLNQVVIPNSPSVVSVTCAVGGTTCTQTGSAPSNGTQIVMSANLAPSPTPINPGQPYYVVGSSGSSFGLSFTSGGSAVVFDAYLKLNQHNTSTFITCTISGNTCTNSSGSAPANGTFWDLDTPDVYPNGSFYIVNASGSTFQLSLTSGGAAVSAFTHNGASYIPYAQFNGGQARIVVHSTASAALLPPGPSAGQDATQYSVGLHEDSISQYTPNMPNFMCSDPNPTAVGYGFQSCFTYAPLAGAYWFQNILYSTDPAVYTNSVAAAGNDFDPIGFNIVGPESTFSNFNLTYNQCALIPAPPPSRSVYANFDGVGVSWINSYQSGLDWWGAFPYFTTPVGFTSSSITIPAFTMFWVTSGGTSGVGQRASCTVSAASVSGIGGGASGNFAVWMDHSCGLHAQFPTGTTYTTATNISVTTATTPAFPTYSLTTNGHAITGYTVLSVAPLGTISSGAVTAFSNNGAAYPAKSAQPPYQGGGGIEVNAWGPWLFDNDYFRGGEIVGPFITDGITSGSPCYPVGQCPMQFQIGNYTLTRSNLYTHPSFLYPSSLSTLGNWNGGNYFWRNMGENKAGKWTLQDGNLFGPFQPSVGYGQAGLHEAFTEYQIPGFINYIDSSEWTFSNNSVVNTPGVGLTVNPLYFPSEGMPYPIKNILVSNNLFINNNGWTQNGIQPMGQDNSIVNPNDGGACGGGANGGVTSWGGNGESSILDHNTFIGQGGCQPTFDYITASLSSNHQITNNILNLVGFDPSYGAVPPGSYYNPNGNGTPVLDPCFGYSASNLYNGTGSCLGMTGFKWGGNVLLATWRNSNPSSLTEYGTSDVTTYSAIYPTANWPNAATLASRISQVGWADPTVALNFRLRAASSYVSGNQSSQTSPTTDGLDAGANIDQLEQHQGKVTNIRILGTTSTTATIGFYAPDSFACGVDWGTTAFYNGSGSWSRVTGSAGSPDVRNQSVTITGATAHSLIYYRLNCAVMQPTGIIQLP